MIENRREKLLLIGPFPPPEHGTSIPFKIFADYIRFHCDYSKVYIIDTQSGDKTKVSAISPKVILPFIKFSLQLIKHGPFYDKIIIFGSSRFVALTSIFYIPFLKILLRKEVYIRIFGGGFGLYFDSSSNIVKKITKAMFKKSDKLILETNHLYNKFIEYFPLNLEICYNYRIKRNYKIIENKKEDGAIRFLYVGDIREEKGIGELLNAITTVWEKTRKSGLKIYLDLYGPVFENIKESLDRKVKNSNGRLRHFKSIAHSELINILPSYDSLILPSYFIGEGYSGIFIDSLMSGLPVIATNFQSLSEMIGKDGYAGFLCNPKDVDSLVNNINKFINLSLEEKNKMRQHAFRQSEMFDSDIVLLRLCRQLGLKTNN